MDDWLEGDHERYYAWLDEVEDAGPRYGTRQPMTDEELREEEEWMKRPAMPQRLPPLYGPPEPPPPDDDLPF